MDIEKIDNGYTVKYQVENTPNDDFSAYTYHTFAFTTWTDLVDWVSKNEKLVD